MKTLYLAIISIGFILGIGITVIFGILMIPRQSNISITIQGLKDTYEIGEQFSFHVKVNGYGRFCGGPAVEIFKTTNRSEIVWTYDGNEFIGINCPERDLDLTFGFRNISINQTGSYIVSINNKIETEFSVVQLTQESSGNQVTLTGKNAQRICGALNLPCTTEPSFQAKQIGDTYVVMLEINGKSYTVMLNATSYCVSPQYDDRPSCNNWNFSK